MSLKVCLLTGSRADYGPLLPLLKAMRDHDGFDPRLIVTGSHLEERFGQTVGQIEADGQAIAARLACLPPEGTPQPEARAVFSLLGQLIGCLDEMAPDLVLLLGDRYELLAMLAACVCLRLPLVHVGGGHVTSGAAVDEQVRHALTKAAHLHCVASPANAGRVAQMGEEPWRICLSGSLGLDNILALKLPPAGEVLAQLGLDPLAPFALITFHPVTLEPAAAGRQSAALLKALAGSGLQAVITWPNADAGHQAIADQFRAYAQAQPGRAVLVPSLGQLRYLGLMQGAAVVLGNSSSGIIEAPSFGVPVVNIGQRQDGRSMADNIFQAGHAASDIARALALALARGRRPTLNPYGDGRAAARILDFLLETFASRGRQAIMHKRFAHLPAERPTP